MIVTLSKDGDSEAQGGMVKRRRGPEATFWRSDLVLALELKT